MCKVAKIDSNGRMTADHFKASVLWNNFIVNYDDNGPYFNMTSTNVLLQNRNTTSNVLFTIKGMASQTGNLQEWQDSAGTVYAFINPYGQLSIGQSPTIYSNARISLNTVATTVVGMVIRAVASQSANLQEWQNSSGGVDTAITSTGRLSVRTTLADAGLNVGTPSAATVGAIIRGVTSQTADLQQWQNSAGQIGTKIGAYGQLIGSNSLANGIGGTIGLTMWGVIAGAANFIPIVARGYALGQSANLQEWQNSSGTVLARVTNSGVIGTSVGVYSPIYQGNNGVGGAITFANDTAITITPQSASVQSLIVKGAASQSANLQEWQDSSGTILTSVSKDGFVSIGAGSNTTYSDLNVWKSGEAAIDIVNTNWKSSSGMKCWANKL